MTPDFCRLFLRKECTGTHSRSSGICLELTSSHVQDQGSTGLTVDLKELRLG